MHIVTIMLFCAFFIFFKTVNDRKQLLIRLVAVKNDKKFSKSKKENYKIGAIISNQK